MLEYKIKRKSLIKKLNIFSILYKLLGIKLYERNNKNITKPNLITKSIAVSLLIISIINLIRMFSDINYHKFTLNFCISFLINFTPYFNASISFIILIFYKPEKTIEMIENYDKVEEFLGKNTIYNKTKILCYISMFLICVYHSRFIFVDMNYLKSYIFVLQFEYFLCDVIQFQQNVWIIMIIQYLYEINKMLKYYHKFKTMNDNLKNLRKVQIHLTTIMKILCTKYWVTVNIYILFVCNTYHN